VKTTGDGFLATFDSPSRAVRAAAAIVDATRAIGVQVRAGLHTGEVERRGDDVAGLAVHVGARVAAFADADEVVVSSTVRDLVLGAGFAFDDRGTHRLKGIDGEWRLLALRR
jgi:class 3 adenylate cyclase